MRKKPRIYIRRRLNPAPSTAPMHSSAHWTYVTNALIHLFLADEILQNAYDAVVRATQRVSEDEVKFEQRITDAARE